MQDQEHKEHSILGLSRVLKSDRPDLPSHPSRGGSRGYDMNMRNLVLDDVLVSSVDKAAEKHGVSTRTIRRWLHRVMPYRQTGNKARENLTGLDQFLLCLAIHIYPRGSSDEYAAFIYRRGGTKVYSRAAISKRCSELKLRRKKCSLEAYKAILHLINLPPNQELLMHQIWFTHPATSLSLWNTVGPSLIHVVLSIYNLQQGTQPTFQSKLNLMIPTMLTCVMVNYQELTREKA